MSVQQVKHFEQGAALSTALAARIAEDLRTAIAQNGHASLALSGGRTPIPLFQALSQQELEWDKQRIQFKFSFHHKSYSDPTLIQRSNKIFGSSTAERFLKDYNGQTYWLSANIKSFFPKSKMPAWINVAVGTGAEGLFGANENIGKDASGNINFNRTDIKRYRQWYFAPDIDLTKIRTKKKGIKVALNILNIVKFPMPSLEYSNGRFRVNAITF